MDKPYPKSHVMMIGALNMLSVLIGLAMLAAPFAKGWYPGGFDTTVHVALGALIAAAALFRAALGYGSIWLDVVLAALGVLTLMLPKWQHMQWNAGYTTAHLVGGGIVAAVAVLSLLVTIPVNRRMRTA
jgi:hypothetical protein